MVYAQETEFLVKENLAPIGPAVTEPLPVQTMLFGAVLLMAVTALAIFFLPRVFSRALGLNSVLALSSAAVLGALLPFTLYALSSSTTVLLKAAPGSIPTNIEIQNITPHGFEVVWETEAKVVGLVKYGTDPRNLQFFALDINNHTPATTHRVKLTNLNPSTTYYFEIFSGKIRFNHQDQPLKVTTK